MPKLRLVFTGLLGYVESEVDGKKKLSVVFTGVPNPESVPSRDRNPFIALPHFAFMSFKPQFLGTSRRLPQIVYSTYGLPDQRYGLFLGREALSIDFGGKSEGVRFYKDDTIVDGQPKPDPNLVGERWLSQRKDCRWILEMEKAHPGCGTIDCDCLNGNKKELIATRLDILDGYISVSSLAGEQDLGGGKRDASVYRLREMDDIPEVRQALAEEVTVEIDIPDGISEVRFKSKPLGTGVGEEDLVLKTDGQDIECNFINAELDQIAVGPKNLAFDTENARDLVLLYDLANNRPPVKRRRFPSVSEAVVSNGAVVITGGPAGDRICPGARFNG